jgi:hypothetical protein
VSRTNTHAQTTLWIIALLAWTIGGLYFARFGLSSKPVYNSLPPPAATSHEANEPPNFLEHQDSLSGGGQLSNSEVDVEVTAKGKQIEIEIVDLEPGRSINIFGIGYDPETETMLVKFKADMIYQFDDVPAEFHEQLLEASSVGQYFHRTIRQAFQAQRLQ